MELRQSLGFWTIVALTVTAMVGTGMFFGASIGASFSGNASILAWIILAIITIYVSTCFGELISMFPKAGGVYEFSKQTYGAFFSFLIGWLTWIVGNITTAVLIVAAFDFILPGSSIVLPGINISATAIKVILSILVIIAFNTVTYRGIQASGKILIFFASLAIIVLLSIIIPGAGMVNTANYTPFFLDNWQLMILVTLFFIIETFFGWESASFLAEETKNPTRTIPRALVFSTIIVTLIGVATTVITLGIIPFAELSATPIIDLAALIYGPQAIPLLQIGVFLTLIGSAVGGIVSSPRLLLGLARDKLFIAQFAHIHPKFQTPHKAIVFQTVVTILVVLVAFGQYQQLLQLLVPAALIMYLFVVLAVPILRRRHPDMHRPFKAPMGTFLPYVIVIIYAGIILTWLFTIPGSFEVFKLLLSFLIFGIPIYFLLLFHYDPDAIRKVNDTFAYLNLALENFLLPKGIRKQIMSHFTHLEDKTILDFGCGVGSLTIPLAKAVGHKGKVYAVDMSLHNVNVLKKRISTYRLQNIIPLHDEHQTSRVTPEIRNVDFIFSVGALSYIPNLPPVLKDMKNILPKNGGIVLVEYVDFFWFIPNLPWLNDTKKIERIFRTAGFSVRVERKRSFFWKYVFIYGINSEEDIPFI